jgi:hypothetical protein
VNDVNHLDKVPLGDEELHGRKGLFQNARRPARKILYEMKWIMNYAHAKVKERNLFPAKISPATVDQMFQDISDIFPNNTSERSQQVHWGTVYKQKTSELRKNKSVGG